MTRAWTQLRAGYLLSFALLALTAPGARANPTWDTTAYDFGSQTVGTSASRTFTLTAVCDFGIGLPPAPCLTPPTGTHMFGPVTVTGDGLALGTPNTCASGTLSTPVYPSMVTCTTAVVFTPSSAGFRSGTLDTTAPGADVALSGTGIAPSTTATAPTSTTPTAPARKKCKKKKRNVAAAKKCKKKKN